MKFKIYEQSGTIGHIPLISGRDPKYETEMRRSKHC